MLTAIFIMQIVIIVLLIIGHSELDEFKYRLSELSRKATQTEAKLNEAKESIDQNLQTRTVYVLDEETFTDWFDKDQEGRQYN